MVEMIMYVCTFALDWFPAFGGIHCNGRF